MDPREKDLEILQQMGDRKLLELCLSDPEVNSLCKDEKFWYTRLVNTYRYRTKDKSISWRNFYLKKLIEDEEENLVRKNKILLLYGTITFGMENRQRILRLIRYKITEHSDIIDIKGIPLTMRTRSINTKILDREKKQYKKIIIFIPKDIFANIKGHQLKDKKRYLNILAQYGDLFIPDLELIDYIGSKKYTKDFKEFILPNTLTYPEDKNIIATLPLGDYILKYGYSGADQGNIILREVSGSDIAKKIQEEKDKRRDWSFADPNFLIVQPLSPLFKRCDEYRILVVNGKIMEIYYGVVGSTIGSSTILNTDFKTQTHRFLQNNSLVINNNIYTFIKQVYNKLTNISRIDPILGLRIDIVIDCSDTPTGNYAENILPDIFNPDWSGNIYVNEIDTIASGVWGFADPVENSMKLKESDPITLRYCNVQIKDNNIQGMVESFEGIELNGNSYCKSEVILADAILNRIL